MGNNAVAADELRLLIERVERLEEEKKAIADDIKSVYSEAKSRGFCAKTMKRIAALRKLDDNERREMEAMLDLYKGALGMLDGTPLGNWAVERLKKDEQAKRTAPPAPDDAAAEFKPAAEEPAPVPEEAPLTIDDAKRLGAEAARDGKSVTANPFPPRDPRRAAWDEAWCRELGTDGMDIPAALRPAGRKPKADADESNQDGGNQDGGDRIDSEEPTDGKPNPADAIDAVYAEAVERVKQAQYASVSKIQKWFSIGYNRAARIIEQMESAGIVSPPSPDGKREVLVDENGQPK